MKTKKERFLEAEAEAQELITIMNNTVKHIKRTDASHIVLTSSPYKVIEEGKKQAVLMNNVVKNINTKDVSKVILSSKPFPLNRDKTELTK